MAQQQPNTNARPRANPKPKVQAKPQPTWSMFPLQHGNVADSLEAAGHPFTFHTLDSETGCIQEYDTHVFGKFRCHSRRCGSKVWTSGLTAITIREYPNKHYNARVYYQGCQACHKLSKPKLDESYAERVAYRLLKWSGVEQVQPTFNGESKGPHLKNLCEGCKAGHCAEGNRTGGLGGLAARLGSVTL